VFELLVEDAEGLLQELGIARSHVPVIDIELGKEHLCIWQGCFPRNQASHASTSSIRGPLHQR